MAPSVEITSTRRGFFFFMVFLHTRFFCLFYLNLFF